MAIDTLTIILEGEVPLAEFARTIESFYELVKALSDEVGTPDLDWVLDDLQFSSAVATVRAPQNPQSAEKVVNAYAEVGASLESQEPIRYSPRVRLAARKVVSISDSRVRSVRFETSTREATVRVGRPLYIEPETPSVEAEPVAEPTAFPLIKALNIAPQASLGGLQGRVQVLSNRGGLRFTMYDLLYDKAVSCYVAEGKEELLRDVWGKLAVVEGQITRDPLTGRPLAIRQVSNITPVADPEPAARMYELARGAVKPFGNASPEETIRRLRDAQ